MFRVFLMIMKALVSVLRVPLIILGCVIALFMLICLVFVCYYLIRGRRFPRSSHKRPRKHGFFRKLLVDAPRRFVLDQLERDPEFFDPQGLIIFTGFQGSGKTSAMSQYILDLRDAYPLARVITNYGFNLENEQLVHYTQLMDYKNGMRGVIVGMDELQNWFSSRASRDFPPEMLSVITQNRKNRRVILGTAQSFYMIAKDIRSQCTEVRQCFTLLRCITIVVRRRPVCDESGTVKELKWLGIYWFVHNERLRGSYDTYRVIDNLSKTGFVNVPTVRIG